MTDEDFDEIRELVRQMEGRRPEKAGLAGTLAGIHMLTMSRAEAISVDFSPLHMEYDASGLRMLETARQTLERILFCGYAYRYSKDRKFLDHATFDLRTVCNFSTWNADRHFLDAAEMALAVGIAYDWLYDELSDDDRSTIVSALERNAFDPATDEDIAWFYWSEGNWNQVCNAGLATAALAVYGDRPEGVAGYGDRPEGVAVYGDRPEGVAGDNNQQDSAVSYNTAFPSDSTVQKIITDAVWSNRRAMETIYSPEGCYAEGPNYWSYGNMFQAVLLSAFESATGSDQGLSSVKGFDKTAKYKQLTYRTNWNTFIQDGNIFRTDGHIFNYSDNIDELKPAYPLWYFAWKFGDWSLIDQELHLLAEGKYSDSSEFRLLPLLMIYALRMPDAATKPEDPGHAKPSDRTQNADTSDRIQNAGTSDRIQTYTNYGTSDRLDDLPLMMVKGSDFYLGIKGGSPTTNHAHMDGGSFVYDAFGKSWAIDPSRASYTKLERACSEQGGDFWDMSQESLRWQFQTMNNEGHSTITVNGKNFNVKGKATITETISPTLGESQRAAEESRKTSEESRKAAENQYGAVMDLSSLYEGELAGAERRIWIDGDGNLTVEDCLSALPGKDAELRWSFVTPANVTVGRKGITLENEGTMVLLRTKSKARISYRLFPSDSDAYSICGFEARVKGGEKVVFRSRVHINQRKGTPYTNASGNRRI